MTNLEAIAELRQEFGRRGWYRKASGRIILELLVQIGIALAGIAIFIAFHNPAVRVLAILISTYGSIAIGTNTHTSSHYATSTRRWLNEALTYFGYPMFLGLSATYWWHKHVVVHHPAPNVIGVDTDADLLPWFAMTQDEVRASRGLLRFYYKHVQFWFFPIALAMNCFALQRGGWLHIIRILRNPKERKRAHWIDLGALTMHYALWLGLPLLFWPLQAVVGLYILRTLLLGYAMFAVLAPGHFPADATRTAEEARNNADFFTRQTMATVNFRTGLLGRFMCSGLQYQIEHHLFPHISHIHYPRVSVMVQAFCRERGLPYRSYGWATVLWKSWEVLRSPQRVIGTDAQTCALDAVGEQVA